MPKRTKFDPDTFKEKIYDLIESFNYHDVKIQKKRNHLKGEKLKKYTIENVPKFLICPMSQEPFVRPITFKCGHTFDSGWIIQWIQQGNYSCPTCKRKYDISDLTISENITISNMIDMILPHYRENALQDDEDEAAEEDENGNMVVNEKNRFHKRLDMELRQSIYNGRRALEDINIKNKKKCREWFNKIMPFILQMTDKGWKYIIATGDGPPKQDSIRMCFTDFIKDEQFFKSAKSYMAEQGYIIDFQKRRHKRKYVVYKPIIMIKDWEGSDEIYNKYLNKKSNK